jgi:2-alkyl-3-oxoalkanoate reductase
MRVLVAGATGVLGRGLVRLLASKQRQPIGLTRDERGDRIVAEDGGIPLRQSLFESEAIASGAGELDAIVHAATAIPKKSRPSSGDWRANDCIRVEGIKSLIDVAKITGAGHLVFQSIVWVARPADQSPFDEDSPVNPDSVTESAAEAERLALEAANGSDLATTILRGGWFYGPDAWHTRSFGEGLKKRMLPIVGDGSAYWSILHTDDAASAYLTALEHRPEGVFHVVDNEPAKVGDFFRYFAERQGAKPPRRVPVWLAKLAAGSFAADFATTSMITSADRFKQATGWRPRYPDFRAGLDQVVSSWEATSS